MPVWAGLGRSGTGLGRSGTGLGRSGPVWCRSGAGLGRLVPVPVPLVPLVPVPNGAGAAERPQETLYACARDFVCIQQMRAL